MKKPKEVHKANLIAGAIDGKYTNKQVAAQLRIGIRQVKKLKKKYREEGSDAVIHGNSGRHPANYTKPELRERIVELKKKAAYSETNFTHFMELLEEREFIKIGYTALRNIMKEANIKSPKTHRGTKKQSSHREPKAMEGELVQTDASPFDWLGIGKRIALHGFQDDATGDILGLYFCENECLQGYYEAFRPVLLNYGVPAALYADKIGIFFVNTKKPENWSIEEQLAGKCLEKTQFGYIADELGCEIIPAGSPQAKGRIERLWETLQDRLSWWLKDKGIKTIAEANTALPEFIKLFNFRFGRKAKNTDLTAFVKLPAKYNLDTLLVVKHHRKTDNCGAFSYKNYMFQIEGPRILAKRNILFVFSEKLGFKACYDKKFYDVRLLGFKNKKSDSSLPDVTKRLLYDCFFKSLKKPA